VLETTEVSGQKALDKLYEHYMDEGGEGQIIRLDKEYAHKRTTSLLKRKSFSDKEWTILDVVGGVGNRAGTAGYMVFKTDAGVEFRSNIKGSFDYLKQVLKDRNKLIGKQATIKYFNLTPDRLVPRFPYVIAIDRKSYEG
jgi:ATP-dependent DNA ligase